MLDMPVDPWSDTAGARGAHLNGDHEKRGGSMATSTEPLGGSSVSDNDLAQLHKLGYAQELRRRMGGFSNFAVSFTTISVLAGCLTLDYFCMKYGGPVV